MSKDITQLLEEQNALILAIARKQKQHEESLLRIARALLLHINAGTMKKDELDYIMYGEKQNANS